LLHGLHFLRRMEPAMGQALLASPGSTCARFVHFSTAYFRSEES
jgi:hypothetical protein